MLALITEYRVENEVPFSRVFSWERTMQAVRIRLILCGVMIILLWRVQGEGKERVVCRSGNT